MATEISGGGIYWKSGLDNSDFKKGEQEIVSGFQRIEKAAQKSGDVLDKSISSKLGANAAQNIAILERELAKYEKTLERVSGSTTLGGKGFEGLKSQIRALYSEIDRQQAVLSKGGGISSTVIGETEKVVQATTKGANGITKVVSGAWGFLRQAAYLIPGLGIAGIIGAIVAGFVKLFDLIKNGNVALDSHSNAMREVNRLYADNAKLSREITKSGKEYISVINDNSVTARAQVDAYTALQTLYKGRLNDLDLETFKLKNSADQQKYLNQQIDNINLDKLRSEYEKAANAADSYQKKLTEIQTGQTSAAKYGSTDSVVRGLEEARQKAELLKAELDRVSEIERVAAMTEAQKVDYFTQQLNVVKQNLTYWESAHGLLLRNNDGTIELGKNLHALTIAPLLNQYNQLLNRINLANQAIGGKADLMRQKDELQKKLDNLKPTDFLAGSIRRDIISKMGVLDKKLEFWDVNADERNAKASAAAAAAAAAKASRLSAAQSRKAEAELNKQNALKQKFADLQNKINESAEKYTFLEKTQDQVAEINDFFDDLKREVEKFNTDPKNKISLFESIKKNRKDSLTAYDEKLKRDAEKKQLEDESKHLADLLTKYATYEQQKKALREQYEKDITRISPGQQAERKRQYDEDVANLDEAEAKKLISVKKYADEAIYTTKLAVRQQLEILNEAYNQAGLSPEAKEALKGRIDEVTKLLSLSDSELTSTQIDAEINKKQAAINELAKAGKQGTDEFKRLNDELMRLKQEKLNYLTDRIDTFRALSSAVGQLGNALSSLGDSSPALASIGNALQSVSSSADLFISNWERLANSTLKSADKIQMAATFIVNALNDILQSVQQNKLKEAEALQNVIDFQRGYNLALIEEQKIRDEMANNVFYKDNMRTIRANLSKQISLVKEYGKAMKDLESGQVKVGTKKVRDWGAVASSTVAGAGAGAVIGATGAGVLSIPGAIIGGAVGFISGMLKKRQVVDVYDNLLKKYPLLIDAEGNLNDAMAKSLLSSNLLDAKTKETLQYVSNLAEEYKKAKAEIDEVVKSLIGDVGNNIMSELVNNFKNGGEDAGEAFRRGFAKSLEKLYEDIIYAAIFGKDLQKMQDRIEKGFETGDMGIMETAMYEFLDGYEQKAEAQQEMMKRLQDYAKSKGIDIWEGEKTSDKTKNKNSLSGAYAQASQESIDLLSGQTMAFKIAQLETNGHLVQMKDYAFRGLGYAERTANNTANTVARLDTIISKMNNNANNALAAGL